MELAGPATTFVIPGDNCRLPSFDGALRSLGAGRPWAGVTALGVDWLVGAVCGLCLFACWFCLPFRLGAIRNKISVRSIAFHDAAALFKSKLVSPLTFLSSTHSPTPVDPLSPFRVEPLSSH